MDSRPGFKECGGVSDSAGACRSRHESVSSVCSLIRRRADDTPRGQIQFLADLPFWHCFEAPY